MIIRNHPLTPAAPGTTRELQSLHYGVVGAGPKAVVQASIHADEAPGMLVAHHLRSKFAELERRGRVRGEIVLIPFANPIGLSQLVLQRPVGRFDLASGENFNRRYADVLERVGDLVAARIGDDAAANVAVIRRALAQACEELPVDRELQSLRKTLLQLAIDADVVLDLHCDHEAVVHLYTATQLWPEVEPLARLLGARMTLLASNSGEGPFDEACSMLWPRLAAQLSQRLKRAVELPSACVALTVELRGEADVSHDLAERDAQAIVDYLIHRGVVKGEAALPSTQVEARPFAGCIPIVAPHSGVLVFTRELGETLSRGDRFADIVDPASGDATPLLSPVDGLFLARESRRFVHAGMRVAKVAGREATRTGNLLSP